MGNAVKYWTWQTYQKAYKFTKRYVVYSYSWWWPECDEKRDYIWIHDNLAFKTNEYAEFDTLDEVNEFISYSQEVYKDVEKPILIKEYLLDKNTNKKYSWGDHKPAGCIVVRDHYDCAEGKRKFIGYLIFDYQDSKIVNMVGDKHPDFKNYKKDLELLDILFRKPGEIPEDYKWDNGEYEGWLQFRWGNGLNAIEKEDEINLKKKEESRKNREKQEAEKKEFEELFSIKEEGD